MGSPVAPAFFLTGSQPQLLSRRAQEIQAAHGGWYRNESTMLLPPFSCPQAGIGDERSKKGFDATATDRHRREDRTENSVVLTIFEGMAIGLLRTLFRHSRSSPSDFYITAGRYPSGSFRR